MRSWQVNASRAYDACRNHDFLAVATPGSGKTLFALHVAHKLFELGTIERLVVVCPTKYLKEQWADKALTDAGIELDADWESGSGHECSEVEDYHGMVVTYAAVANWPAIYRKHCKRPTLVIFDEIHHAGDEKHWGNGILEAFQCADRRLCISGTPFRTDNNQIPFVNYDDTGVSKADFRYDYAAAIGDEVCREIIFPSYESSTRWMYGAELREADSFSVALPLDQQNQRLLTTLMPDGEWIQPVFTAAHKRLMEMRANGHANAAGLIIASDQSSAKAYAKVLRSITRIVPALAISEDPAASDTISAFRDKQCSDPWLVAVRMVSEGVDIPRLRVGVYATNITTEIYFRQAVGRFVRWIPELEDQSGYIYFPKDDRLVEYVQTIQDERDHQLHAELEAIQRDIPLARDRQMGLYAPIVSTGTPDDVFFQDSRYCQSDITKAQIHLEKDTHSRTWDPAIWLQTMATWTQSANEVKPPEATAHREPSVVERRKVLRTRINSYVDRMVARQDNCITQGEAHGKIHGYLIDKQNGKALRDCSIAELECRIAMLTTMTDTVLRGILHANRRHA
jgi:superfamily II DNA or RNA helicase